MNYSTDFKVFSVTGEDAESFLQGQLSNDVNIDGPTAFCNPKGAVLALFILKKTEQGFLLASQDECIDAVIQRLRMFVLRSKVVIENTDSVLIVNADSNDHTFYEAHLSLQLRAQPLTDAVSATPQLMQAGLFKLTTETSGQFTAQFLNLDLINALSWQKGCYVGQEVIARLHYRGKVTKRCYLLQSDSAFPEKPGDNVSLMNQQNQPVRGVILQTFENQALGIFSSRSISDKLTLDARKFSIIPFSYE